MVVGELMTQAVVTAGEELSFREVACLLEANEVSGLPVVDAGGRVVGVVSEADLLLKAAHEVVEERHWHEPPGRREERAKAAGRIVRDLMTSPAVTATPSMPVAEAARRLYEHGIKRLPVVDPEGRPVGTISRGDVTRVFLREDAELRKEIVDGILLRTLAADPDAVEVEVEDGVVTLGGKLPLRSEVEVLERLAAEVPGVVAVPRRARFARDAGRGARRLALLDT